MVVCFYRCALHNDVMNKKFLIAVVLGGLFIVGAFFVLNSYIYSQKQIPNPVVLTPGEAFWAEVIEPEVGLSFSYRSGVDGYVLMSTSTGMSVDPEFKAGYMLTRASDIVALAEVDVPTEGAPTMQVRVYENARSQSLQNWTQTHPLETNIELALESSVAAEVSGVPAIMFKADGLYASLVYVVQKNSLIYVFTTAYIDEADSIVADFKELLSSVSFVEREVVAPSYTPLPVKPGSFRGTLEEVNVGCFVDGECYVVVDDIKVTVVRGWSSDTVGKVIGVDGFGDLEAFIGEEVEVYAKDVPDGTKTLYGSEDFYVKLVASAGSMPRIGETTSILGVSITPNQVLEDSRCPVDVTCIWAGTVRLSATVVSGLGKANQEFTLNVPVTTEAEEITLVRVDPGTHSQSKIEASEYSFFFKVSKR